MQSSKCSLGSRQPRRLLQGDGVLIGCWLLHDKRDVLAAERTSGSFFHKMICLAPYQRPTE